MTLAEIVADGGDTRAILRARVWEEFVDNSLGAIDQAMAVLTARGLGYNHEAEPSYWRRRTRTVANILSKLPEEDSITDVLSRALEYVREHAPATSYLRRNQICFPPQQPRKQQRKLGTHALTTDIQVRSLSRSFLDLQIEAKVLFEARDVKHYCGGKGLLRFSDRDPYTDQPVGMMVGYSLRDDMRWIGEIEANTAAYTQVRSFADVRVGGRTVRVSVSSRHKMQDVTVIHLFLPFRTDPDAR